MTTVTPLPWVGETSEERWFGTTLFLTAKRDAQARKGTLKDGFAELLYVLRGGELLQIKFMDFVISQRVTAEDYDIHIVELIDNQQQE